MKKYNIENGILYVGTARQICSLYKNFLSREIVMPSHCDFPKFNMGRMYGLLIDFEDDVMYVASSDTVVRILCQ